jgi:hypothetical protein
MNMPRCAAVQEHHQFTHQANFDVCILENSLQNEAVAGRAVAM